MPEVTCVGGRVLLDPEITKPAWWLDHFDGMVGEFDRGEEADLVSHTHGPMIGIGANLSFRRSVFVEVGGFRTDMGRIGQDLAMGEEIDLISRVRKGGHSTLYYPRALVWHRPEQWRFSKRYLRRWNDRYGRWRQRVDLESGLEGVRLLGVPRWKYRELLASLGAVVGRRVRGLEAEALRAELELRACLGYFRSAIRDRSSREATEDRGSGSPN